MPSVDRGRFIRDGFLILRDVIPPDELELLRASYEVILEKQKAVWRDERGPDDPPGGVWEKSFKPTIGHVEHFIDGSTANAVEVWMSESTRGVSEQLLSPAVASISAMQVMCNPTFDYGPADWHRDVHPSDSGPLSVMQAHLIENGPNYVQWNIPLYDDDSFWVVPGSHRRLNSDEENQQLRKDPRVPLPGSVPVELKAGDAVFYTYLLLHWGSNYNAQVLRRTVHGGHTAMPGWDDIRFTRHLSAKSRELFASWVTRRLELMDASERCLRAILDRDRSAYLSGLDLHHPGVGPAGRLQFTIGLCKWAMRAHLLKQTDYDDLPDDVRGRVEGSQGSHLNWGPQLAERFTRTEVDAIWNGFAELERQLTVSDREHFLHRLDGGQGYRFGPIPNWLDPVPSRYHPESMREPFTVEDFMASWGDAAQGAPVSNGS